MQRRGDSDAGGCAGFKELKAKVVPDMLSVLSTAASEDVAHLLGGVDLALFTLQVSSWRVPVDGSSASLIQVVDLLRLVSSVWRLCSTGALFASGAIKYYAGVFTLPSFPCEVSSPCTALDDGA